MPRQLWKPGQSGNPKGAPPRSRALTFLLEQALNTPIESANGIVSPREMLATSVVRLAIFGEVTVGERVLRIQGVEEWARVVQWLYTHVDGPPKPEADSSHELTVHVIRDKHDTGNPSA